MQVDERPCIARRLDTEAVLVQQHRSMRSADLRTKALKCLTKRLLRHAGFQEGASASQQGVTPLLEARQKETDKSKLTSGIDIAAGFRKGTSAEVSKGATPLLKAYQEEIDRLTGRAKAGEAAFLDVYQKLYEAPDPAPALAAGLVRISTPGGHSLPGASRSAGPQDGRRAARL